jgi:tetratricopeptide (TPR) repeat protein
VAQTGNNLRSAKAAREGCCDTYAGHQSGPTERCCLFETLSAQAALGEVGLAIGDYSTALKLKPDMVEAFYDRGLIFMQMHRFESAMADFTEAIRIKPDFVLAYCNRGMAAVRLGRYDDALADYSTAIKEDQEVDSCWFSRGNLYLLLGDYQKAISDYSVVLGNNRFAPIALSRRGQAHEAIGQTQRALDDYNAALAIVPRLKSAREGVARVTARQQHSNSNDNGHPAGERR